MSYYNMPRISREEKLFLILYTIKLLDIKLITRIQKTLFVYSKEYDSNTFLFVPNNFGANSFELRDEIHFLKNSNYLKEQSNDRTTNFILTENGENILKNDKLLQKYSHKLYILKQIIDFANSSKDWLIRYVYYLYPSFTNQSIIYDEIIERMTDERRRDAEKFVEVLRKKIQEGKCS